MINEFPIVNTRMIFVLSPEPAAWSAFTLRTKVIKDGRLARDVSLHPGFDTNHAYRCVWVRLSLFVSYMDTDCEWTKFLFTKGNSLLAKELEKDDSNWLVVVETCECLCRATSADQYQVSRCHPPLWGPTSTLGLQEGRRYTSYNVWQYRNLIRSIYRDHLASDCLPSMYMETTFHLNLLIRTNWAIYFSFSISL